MGYDRGDRYQNDRPGYDRDRGYRAYGGPYGGGGHGREYEGRGESRGSYRGRDRYENDRYENNRDYDEDRGFFDRASDEVRSWFGDEEAERRRERDEYYNRPYGDPRDQSSRVGFAGRGGGDRGYSPFAGRQGDYTAPSANQRGQWDYNGDSDYHAWRQEQLDNLDRDYHEYRSENRNRFHQEFGSWRNRRTTQRSSLSQVQQHAEVVGSDGEHVGTVDKVRGDQIILTKNDQDANGHHHSIPSRWIDKVEDGKVVLEKTADQAKQEWRDAERRGAIGNQGNSGSDQNGPHYLDNAFAGTYQKRGFDGA